MSAIQKTDKLLTLKTDSKQIDSSIFNMESTYSRGTTMGSEDLNQSTFKPTKAGQVELEAQGDTRKTNQMRRRFQPIVAVLKAQPQLINRISRIDVSNTGSVSFHLGNMPFAQTPEDPDAEIQEFLNSMN